MIRDLPCYQFDLPPSERLAARVIAHSSVADGLEMGAVDSEQAAHRALSALGRLIARGQPDEVPGYVSASESLSSNGLTDGVRSCAVRQAAGLCLKDCQPKG